MTFKNAARSVHMSAASLHVHDVLQLSLTVH